MVLVAAAIGYAFGSIPFAWLFGRQAGVDLRRRGTGNVGAGNLGRSANVPVAVVAFFLDVAKAMAAVAIGFRWGSAGAVAAGWGVIAGHSWPVWLRFVGGRGQTVTLAAGGVVAPWATLAILPVLGLGLATRNLALSWLLALAAYPVAGLLFDGGPAAVYATGAAVLAIVRRLEGSPLLERGPLRTAWRSRLLFDREP